MNNKKYTLLVFLVLFPLSINVNAIRMDCTDGLTSELPVDVTVNVPAFIYFQVGSENQTAEVEFDLSGSAPAPGVYAGPDVDPFASQFFNSSSITGSDNSGGVNVTVRANCGQVQLSYAVSDSSGMENASGQFLPFEHIQTTSTDAELPAPVLNNNAADNQLVSTTSYGLVTDRSATWQFVYNYSESQAAGVYQGTVIYQAACL